jgi:hypothetical protein
MTSSGHMLAIGICWTSLAVMAFVAIFAAALFIRPIAMLCCMITFGLASEFAWYCLDHCRHALGLKLLDRETAEVME